MASTLIDIAYRPSRSNSGIEGLAIASCWPVQTSADGSCIETRCSLFFFQRSLFRSRISRYFFQMRNSTLGTLGKLGRSSYLLTSYFARLSRRGTKRKGWRKSWSSSRKVSYLFAGIFAGIRSVTSRTRSILVVVDELVTLRVVDELAIP